MGSPIQKKLLNLLCIVYLIIRDTVCRDILTLISYNLKSLSKFNHRHSELIVEYNIGLKTLLQHGISEPIFYGDLVYKFKRIVGTPSFSDQFKNITKRYINVGYNLDVMR